MKLRCAVLTVFGRQRDVLLGTFMARARKHHPSTPDAKLGGRDSVPAEPGRPSAPGTVSSAKRATERQSAHERQPDPPRPHVWFLVASAVALAAWMAFLAVMALDG